jgi:LacI family transcriptional regulator
MTTFTNSDMSVTILDVARHAAVSPMTVSRVINGSYRVRDETRRRVEAAVAELGYVPNRLARGLIKRRSGMVAVIVPDISNPLFARVARGVEEVAWHTGYQVILCDTQNALNRERGYIEAMLSFRVEGVLIAPVSDGSRANIRLLTQNGTPFVQVACPVPGLEGDVVQGDTATGVKRLVEHLVKLGHRRIGFVMGSAEASSSGDQYRGYRRGLAQAGIPFEPTLVAASTAADPVAARNSIVSLLSRDDRPTAIVAVNNVAIVAVVEAADELQLDIPRDLALASFGDAETDSRLEQYLTVLTQPAETYGTIAAQLLFDRVQGRIRERRNILLPPDLIVPRERCRHLRRTRPHSTPIDSDSRTHCNCNPLAVCPARREHNASLPATLRR